MYNGQFLCLIVLFSEFVFVLYIKDQFNWIYNYVKYYKMLKEFCKVYL